MKKHNFSAGPAILPEKVLREASQAVANWKGNGLSILEVSHRGVDVALVMEEGVQLVKEILGLNEDYEVLFLTGGASTQFFMSAMNLLASDKKACYLDTGSWSSKAIKEAKHFGNIEVTVSSKDKNFTFIPKDYTIPEDAAFVHLTSNNTVRGTQYHSWPDTEVPFVCDMSSDIFSRPIDVKRFGLIYAGAQKNLGPAGTTLVIVRKDMLGKAGRQIPTMLNYQTHIDKGSAFNTPPVFPIYVCVLTLRWIKEMGGLEKMKALNEAKAGLLYKEIDENPCFIGTTAVEDRSLMNVNFVLANPDLETAFFDASAAAGCVGLKGHRSVGGCRASIYNAMPIESVQVLVDVMKAFAKKHG